MHLRPIVLVATLALCACAARRIPGTDIEDTPDTRAILDVMEQYRSALEARDAARIVQLVSPSFQDTAGTPNPSDDLDYKTLKEQLPERLARLDDVKVDLNIRKITIEGDVANVIYYYNTRFRIPKLTNRLANEGDLQQMWLQREGGQWRILSGI